MLNREFFRSDQREKFWRLVDSVVPDCVERKEWLKVTDNGLNMR